MRRKCRRFGCAFIDQISLERTPKHRRPKRSYNVPPPPPPTSSSSSSFACSTFSQPTLLVFLSPSVFQTVHKTVIRKPFSACIYARRKHPSRETDKRRVSKIAPRSFQPYCFTRGFTGRVIARQSTNFWMKITRTKLTREVRDRVNSTTKNNDLSSAFETMYSTCSKVGKKDYDRNGEIYRKNAKRPEMIIENNRRACPSKRRLHQ